MWSKKFLLYFLLSFLCFSVYAQQGGIELKVIDENQYPVSFASVVVYDALDSSQVAGNTTNDKGYVKLRLKPGDYYLLVTFLSYQKAKLDDIEIKNKVVSLGTISLTPKSVSLNEIEVSEEKSSMQFELDKRVFNVGKDLSTTGGNATEILENVPSVTVDAEGNVSLRGSQNVRILINGKPSGLIGINSTEALRQLMGNMIERIEVITNPSARYDAEGEVGIINIILKKEKKQGVNGSFEAVSGYPENFRLGGNINYRRSFFNLFANLGANYRRSPGYGYSIQEFDRPDTAYSFERLQDRSRGGLGTNFQFGSDFYLNENNIITVSGLYKFGDDENITETTYRDFNEAGIQTQTVIRDQVEQEDEYAAEGSISYVKSFDSSDREFSADIKYILDDDTELADIVESGDINEGTINQRSSNVEDEVNWFFQANYIHPLWKDAKFETGTRVTLRNIVNDFTVEQKNSNGDYIPIDRFDNEFNYQENIYAAYAMLGDKSGSFSYQAGLRAEYSDIKTELLKTNEVNPRKYLNLFPSASITYKLNKLNNIQASYSRRISRPDFRALLPFYNYSDSRNFYAGNPNLNPEFTHSFELGYLKYYNKGSILSSIYYRHRDDVIDRITTVDSTGFSTRLPVNLAEENAFGLEFNWTYDPTKFWQINVNANFYRAITEGEYEGESYYADAITFTSRASSRLKFWEEYRFQTSLNYRAPRNTTQGVRKALYVIDAGLSKEFFDGRGTLTLSVRDMLNSRVYRSIIDEEQYRFESEFQWRARQWLLSFSYRLNQKDNKGKRN